MPIHDQFLVAAQSTVLRRIARPHLGPTRKDSVINLVQLAENTGGRGGSQEHPMTVIHTGTRARSPIP